MDQSRDEQLTLARADATGALVEDLCFEAQQVADKAIKAVFVHRGVAFPFIHDLDRLLQLLEQSGIKGPRYVTDSKELTRFAVATRYPGFSGPVTKRQYRRSLRIAESVLRWAERKVGKP